MNMRTRRLVGGLVFLALAGYLASRTDSSLRLPTVVLGFAFGWILAKASMAMRLGDRTRDRKPVVAAAATVGVAIAVFANSALPTFDPSAPVLLAAVSAAFVAGLTLALRLSPLGRTQA